MGRLATKFKYHIKGFKKIKKEDRHKAAMRMVESVKQLPTMEELRAQHDSERTA